MTSASVATGDQRRPPSIALMLESDGPGGAEMMLLRLAEELRHRGHRVCPVGPADGCGWLSEQFRRRNFETQVFSIRRPLDWGCVQGLIHLLRRQRIDIVHSHEFTMAIYGAAAARWLGKPHVITMHGGQYSAAKRRRQWALRCAALASDRVVAVSAATRRFLVDKVGLPQRKIDVILNGVAPFSGNPDPIRRELAIAPQELLILAVGNLYPVKGHVVLLRALASLLADAPEIRWRLAIAGRGAEEETLRSVVEQHGLANRVHLLGFREDVPDLLAAADIYTMPSLSEGLPFALIEAMFAGKAIVASDVGGIPEVIAPEENGILVPPGDHQGLARALFRLLSDSRCRADFGSVARQYSINNLGIGSMAATYQTLYSRVERLAAVPAS